VSGPKAPQATFGNPRSETKVTPFVSGLRASRAGSLGHPAAAWSGGYRHTVALEHTKAGPAGVSLAAAAPHL